jgi:hypothetical protein
MWKTQMKPITQDLDLEYGDWENTWLWKVEAANS